MHHPSSSKGLLKRFLAKGSLQNRVYTKKATHGVPYGFVAILTFGLFTKQGVYTEGPTFWGSIITDTILRVPSYRVIYPEPYSNY